MTTETKDTKTGKRSGLSKPVARPRSTPLAGAESGTLDQGRAQPDVAERHRRIAEAAYYRAEGRGFAAGYEDADWLEAEKDTDGKQDRVSRDADEDEKRRQ